jgi:uncharacterized protein
VEIDGAVADLDENRPPVDRVALVAIGVTVAGHLTLQNAGPNFLFIALACIFWSGYVAARGIADPGLFRRWGFRFDNLASATLLPMLLFFTGAAGLAAWGLIAGQLRFPTGSWLLFLVYPIWGIVQQFLTLGVFFQSLERMVRASSPFIPAIVSAALFSAVHAPDVEVMIGTFLLELLLIPLFMRHRNLWPLGVVHGWLGALLYTLVLGRNVLEEGQLLPT